MLLAGPADDIVPRQGMKLYLTENQHVVKEVMFMKEWKAADVVAKIKDVFHEKLANCEISILESVHKKLMPPALERGSDLNGEKVSKIFKEKPLYIRPSIQILEPYDHDNGKNKKIKFSPENVVIDSDDSLDEYLQQNPFIDTIPKSHDDLESNVAEQCPDVNNPISTQQESAIQIMSTSGSLVEELSSNELVQQVSGQGHSPTNVHVINLVEEYGALLESSDFEATDDVEDLMEENKTVGTEEASSSQVGDVKEILESLASVIDESSISKFNISRNHLWESAKRGFNRKTFSPAKKMSVKFTDDLGASEGAVDLGGPRRELLTLLLQYLRNSSIFVGEEASKSLTSLAHHIAEDDYFLAGRVIAMSLVHGAAAPKFFSPVLYEALFKDSRHIHVSIDTVPDRGVKEVLKKLHDAADVDAANKVLDENDTLFSLAGTSCFVANENEIKKMAEEVAHWYVLGRCNEALQQFKNGLETLGLLNSIKQFPLQFKSILCYQDEMLTSDTVNHLFLIESAEKGSSRQSVEERVLSYWLDLLEDIQEGQSELTFPDVLFFTTGCKDIPPLGFQPKPYLRFLHQPENDGNQSKFPKANTCANIIMLPVVHKSYALFKEHMELGIKGSQGFGYA